MAVAFDAQGKVASASGATVATLSGTPITVGSGSNRALLVCLNFGATINFPTAITVTWDVGGTNQALTAVTNASAHDTVVAASNAWYGLVAPTAGAKTLTASWTGARACVMGAISFTGVDQTGGTTSFPNGVGTVTTSNVTGTVTITSAVGDMTVASHMDDGGTAMNSVSATSDFVDANTTTFGYVGMHHTAGSASNVMTCTMAVADDTAGAGCSIKAASTAALITGWWNEARDVFQANPQKLSASPAFVSTFRTASISGTAWQTLPDRIKLPPNVTYSAPPAFARVPTIVSTISGMSWFEPLDQTKPRPITVEAFPSIALPPVSKIAGMAWFEPTIDRTSQGRFLTDPVGFGQPVITQTVGISGIGWFEPPDSDKPSTKVRNESFPVIIVPVTTPTAVLVTGWFNPLDEIKVKVSFDRPPASSIRLTPAPTLGWFNPSDAVKTRTSFDSPATFVVRLPSVPISGMSWFEPLDRDRPAFKSYLESLPSVVLIPGTPPTPISGIAWFEPLPNTVRIVLGFSDSPALQQPIIQIIPTEVLVGGKWRWLEGVQKLNADTCGKLLPSVKEAAAVLSSAGGHARAKALTQTQRSNIASNAAKIRWK